MHDVQLKLSIEIELVELEDDRDEDDAGPIATYPSASPPPNSNFAIASRKK
jgi:hypothetical protein